MNFEEFVTIGSIIKAESSLILNTMLNYNASFLKTSIVNLYRGVTFRNQDTGLVNVPIGKANDLTDEQIQENLRHMMQFTKACLI